MVESTKTITSKFKKMDFMEVSGRPSYLRRLKSFQPGEDLSMWLLHFYQDMVGKELNRHFPYEKRTRQSSAMATENRSIIRISGTED